MKTPSFPRLAVASAALILSLTVFASSVRAAQPCRVPLKDGENIPSDSRKDCIARATTAFEQPALSPEALNDGPAAKPGFTMEDEVYCKFFYRDQDGNSKKFRCYRTDEKGSFYSDKGQLMPEAARIGAYGAADEDVMYNSSGVALGKPGKPEEVDVLKVRYSDGTERNRENYISVAAARIFWALGYPSERIYPTKVVKCAGCTQDPWEKKQKTPIQGTSEFPAAAVERKWDGKKITESQSEGWKYAELSAAYRNWDDVKKDQYEGLLLLANLTQVLSDDPRQNYLFCEKGKHDKQTGVCQAPVALVHDLGAAFGTRENPKRFLLGAAPRGDFGKYRGTAVFTGKKPCELWLDADKIKSVSESGRRFFAERLGKLIPLKEDGRRDPSLVKKIFTMARFDQVDQKLRNQVAASGKQGAALDEAVIDMWTAEFMRKADEIFNSNCARSEQSKKR